MHKNDDSDIKIFGSKNNQNVDDTAFIFQETLRQRQNGNSLKAKRLGKNLSYKFVDVESIKKVCESHKLSLDLIKQVYALVQFTTEAALNFYLPSTLLSNISIAAMQDALIKYEHTYYKDVLNSSDFSFYFLSLRKGGDNTAHDIGQAFSMLCGKENDEFYINAGENIYLETLSKVQDKINDYNFTIG